MSFKVTAMVRAARLPRTMKRRPEVKAVLLALADRCLDDGSNAWPAVATIAAESEISARTAHRCLATLLHHDLIKEQSAPRQHKPRVWRLNLDAILNLAPDAQHVAGLEGGERPVSDPQDHAPDPQIQTSDPQNPSSGPQDLADDPVLLNCPLNQKSSDAGASRAPVVTHDKQPQTGGPMDFDKLKRDLDNGKAKAAAEAETWTEERHQRRWRRRNARSAAEANVRVITRLVHDELDRSGPTDAGALAEVVKCQCAARRIAYNSSVVGKAIAGADFQRVRVGKPPSHPSSAGALASRMRKGAA